MSIGTLAFCLALAFMAGVFSGMAVMGPRGPRRRISRRAHRRIAHLRDKLERHRRSIEAHARRLH